MAERIEVYEPEAVKRAKQYVTQLGLQVPADPSVEDRNTELPWNLSESSQADLSQLMTGYSRLKAFARYHHAIASATVRDLAGELKSTVGEDLLVTQGDTVTIRKAQVMASPGIKALNRQLLDAQVLEEMLKSLLDGYDDKYKVVSREISLRDNDSWEGGDDKTDWS